MKSGTYKIDLPINYDAKVIVAMIIAGVVRKGNKTITDFAGKMRSNMIGLLIKKESGTSGSKFLPDASEIGVYPENKIGPGDEGK